MFLSGLGSTQVFLAAGATDLRKSFDGLSALVHDRIQQDPLSGALFVFCNRGRNRVRILHYDGTGLWVFTKRLERGTFRWPQLGEDPQTWAVTTQELLLMLSGIDLAEARPRRWHGRGRRKRIRQVG